MIEHGKKESTRDSEASVRDLSGGQRRQNRAVHSGQGRPAAQEDGHRRNDGVSNVDMDENNALQIKATRVVISTFETLPP